MEEALCTELVAGHQALPNRTEGGNELRYIQTDKKCMLHLVMCTCMQCYVLLGVLQILRNAESILVLLKIGSIIMCYCTTRFTSVVLSPSLLLLFLECK